MKKVYKRPEIKKVELRPQEAMLACGKCPGAAMSPPRCKQMGLPDKQS